MGKKIRNSFLTILACIVIFSTVFLLVLPAVAIGVDDADPDEGIHLDNEEVINENLPQEEQTYEPVFDVTPKAEGIFTAADLEYPAITISETVGNTLVHIDAPYGAFPSGTELIIKEIDPDEKLLSSINSNLEKEKVESVKAIDITFRYENEDIEPLKSIKVSISSDFIREEEKAVLMHIDDQGNGDIVELNDPQDETLKKLQDVVSEDEEIDKPTSENTISFESDSFSVYAIIYTVDLHFDLNGNSYEHSITGGGFLSFREFFDSLDIENRDELLSNIREVSFTSPDLLKVYKTETDTSIGDIKKDLSLDCVYSSELSEEDISNINLSPVKANDWVLISLRPFLSEEILTITLKNDEVFTVKVTDGQIQTNYISADGEDFIITLRYDEQAEIPADANLLANEITADEKAYQTYYENALAALQLSDESQVSFARFFDIEILKDGEKIEPKAPVEVKISYADGFDVQDDQKLQIVHFGQEGVEVIDNVRVNEEQSEVVYEQESFSVTATIVSNPDPYISDFLDEATVKIGNMSSTYFVTNTIIDEEVDRLAKTANLETGADWRIDVSGNNYYLSCNTAAGTRYLDFSRKDDYRAEVVLKSDKNSSALSIENNHDGTFSICKIINGTKYYLNEYNGSSGNGFAGYIHDGLNNRSLVFSSNKPPRNPGELYMVILQKDGKSYQVLNDGSIAEVSIGSNNKVAVEYPLFWTYEFDGKHLSHPSNARSVDTTQQADTWYYKYIDPMQEDGINLPAISDNTGEGGVPLPDDETDAINKGKKEASRITVVNNKIRSLNGDYYIGLDLENMRIIGRQNAEEAATVLFASPDNTIDIPKSDWGKLRDKHVVDHIDISIHGNAWLKVTLAPGIYYDESGHPVLNVDHDDKVVLDLQSRVIVRSDDVKNAELKAFTKDENGVRTYVNDAYFISGYSANSVYDGNSSEQVRIEGRFKVTDVPFDGQDKPEKVAAMYANRIFYDVAVQKMVNFVYSYNNQILYDQNGEALSADSLVELNASFNYWDDDNECPATYEGFDTNNDRMSEWSDHKIPTGAWGNSGMDFRLGGHETSDDVAIEIIKMIVDDQGEQIALKSETSSTFDIYYRQIDISNPDSGRSATDSVRDLNRDAVNENISGTLDSDGRKISFRDTDYYRIHSKTIDISTDGWGVSYDYGVDPGMFLIRETAYDDEIRDEEGYVWSYKTTSFATEYVKRNQDDEGDDHFHLTQNYHNTNDSYISVPEVLGEYYKDNASEKSLEKVLDFYVYNTYEPKTYAVGLLKVDVGDNDKKLAGVEFDLYGPYAEEKEGEDRKEIKFNTQTIVSDENGLAEIGSLTSGIYYLFETKTNAGYVLLAEPVKITVDSSKEGSSDSVVSYEQTDNSRSSDGTGVSVTDDAYQILITNSVGYELPEAGGIGTLWFYFGGAALMMCSLLLMKKKRKVS